MNNKEVKILFMGTAEFGIPTLKVLKDNFNLDAIITNYDKPSGRGLKIEFSPNSKRRPAKFCSASARQPRIIGGGADAAQQTHVEPGSQGPCSARTLAMCRGPRSVTPQRVEDRERWLRALPRAAAAA